MTSTRRLIVLFAAALACSDSSGPSFQSSGPCDAGLALAAPDPLDAAKALGICDGVVSAAWVYPDGGADTTDGALFHRGHGLSQGFGTSNTVREGQTLVVLSSGTARTPSQANYAAELDKGYGNEIPAGFPHWDVGCNAVDTVGRDGIALNVVLKVPAGVRSFAFDYAFFSRDYPDGGCLEFLDQAAALVTGLTGTPGVRNVLLDLLGNPMYVNPGSLRQCVNGVHNDQSYNTCEGTSLLVGTGFDNNGASGWIRTPDLPVTAGDTVRISFMIWDTFDGTFDSSVLLDNFAWKP
jgi:hypothetical protein